MKWDFLYRAHCWRQPSWLVAACLFSATAPCAFALDPTENPTNYIAAHWDTEDGLPHNLVRCIFQTRDGYLWVGTQQGLARFDGLTRIFNHGFTTRKDGHGFGLHSGALAAKEMGGSLVAQSEGAGKGASFTLELPVQPESTTQAGKK